MRIPSCIPYSVTAVLTFIALVPLLASAQHETFNEIGHASYLHGRGRRHRLLAAKLKANLNLTTPAVSIGSGAGAHLQKREGGSRFTFYQTGLGACGEYKNNVDFVVALNANQWDGGSHCFETITVTCNGKKTEAQVTDICPSCPPGALDMSPGLFSFFADQSQGLAFGDWHFGKDEPTPTPTPTPTHTHTLTPTSEENPSKTKKLPLSTLHTQHRVASVPQAKAPTSTVGNVPEPITDATPVPTSLVADAENLADISTVLLDLGAFVGKAADSSTQSP